MTIYRKGRNLIVPIRAEAEGMIGDALIELKPGDKDYQSWFDWAEMMPDYVEDLAEKVLKGGEGSGHHDHVGRPGSVGGSLPSCIAMTVSNLQSHVSNEHRKDLLDKLKNEFPQAMKVGDYAYKDIEEIYVFGSFGTTVEYPNDIDLLIKLKEGTQLKRTRKNNPGTDWETWQQSEHKCHIVFTNIESVAEAILGVLRPPPEKVFGK